MTEYYVVVEEWNYPIESGREVLPETYDAGEFVDAVQKCIAMAEAEKENFEQHVQRLGGDPQAHAVIATSVDSTTVSVKSRPDLYYAVRLIKITPLSKGGK